MLKSDRPRAFDFMLAQADLFQTSYDELFQKIVEFGKPTLLRHVRALNRPLPALPEKKQSWADLVDSKLENRDAIIAELLAFPASLDVLVGGDAFLVTAAKDGLLETVDALLAREADVNVQDRALSNPLAAALGAGQIDTARRFLDKGANANKPLGWQATPIIFKANRSGLALLAERGADFEARDLTGATFLHAWAERHDAPEKSKPFDALDHKEALAIALDHGLSVDVTDHRGETPLHIAARHDRAMTVKYLIAAGATVDAPAHDAFTPYFRALEHKKDAAAEALLAAGARQDYRTPGGWSALHIAAELGLKDILPALWDRLGASDLAASHPPRTALQVAAEADATDVVTFLLGRGVDPDHHAGLTPPPLHLALETGAVQTATVLVEAGAACISVDIGTGMTALVRANALLRRVELTDRTAIDVRALIERMRR